MRQAGIIAAGGLYALRHHVDDLRWDHERARRLAQTLNRLPGIEVNADDVHTNIVIFDVDDQKGSGAEIEERLKRAGLLCLAFARHKIRLVTHRDLTDTDIDQAIQIFQKVFA